MLRVLSLFACLLLAVAPAPAATLYTGEIAVESGAQGGSTHALAALDQVLARLTGRFDTSLVSELGLGVADLDDLVLSRQLVERAAIEPDGETEQRLMLQVEFDAPSIDRLLADRGLPRWGRERPSVLLWAVVEDESGADFVQSPRLEYVLADTARRAGLDLVRPLHDLFDLAELSVQDVRGGFLGSARESAQRYGAGVIAMLDLRRQDSGTDPARWSARWRWRIEGQDSGFEQSASGVEALVERGLERLASSLAARYGVLDTDGQASRWLVSIDGIVDEVQYAEVVGFLSGLSAVEGVSVTAAREREVVFEVLAAGDRLESYLTLGGLLAPRARSEGNRLFYRLAP